MKRKTKIETPRSVRVKSGCPRQQRASKPSAHNSSAINVSLRLYCPNLWPHRRFGLALVRFWYGFCIHIQFYTDHQLLPPPRFAYYFFFHFSYFLIRKKKITIIACYLGLQGLEERIYVRFFYVVDLEYGCLRFTYKLKQVLCRNYVYNLFVLCFIIVLTRKTNVAILKMG